MRVPVLTFENIRAGSSSQTTIWANIPTNGPDAIVSNQWYHVAVTYNGLPNTADNIKLYWTLLDPSRLAANKLTIGSANTQLSGLNPLATVTTPLMVSNILARRLVHDPDHARRKCHLAGSALHVAMARSGSAIVWP